MLVVMKLKILRVKKIIFFCSLLLFLFDLNASEKKEEKIETRISGYWTHYCKNYEKQRQCEIARKINIEQQNETFLIVFKINKDIKSKIKKSFSIITPGEGRINIKKRLKISFDDKTRFTRSFLNCDSQECLVLFKNKPTIYSVF